MILAQHCLRPRPDWRSREDLDSLRRVRTVAQDPPPARTPDRARPHIRIRCIRGGLARGGVAEQDCKPRMELADVARGVPREGRYGRDTRDLGGDQPTLTGVERATDYIRLPQLGWSGVRGCMMPAFVVEYCADTCSRPW